MSGITIIVRPAGKKFETNTELRLAIDEYLKNDTDANSNTAKIYGYPIGIWEFEDRMVDFSNVFSYNRRFTGLPPYQDISSWSMQHGIVFNNMFYHATEFQGNLSQWDMRSARSLTKMFAHADKFAPNIADGTTLKSWDTSKVSDFSYMFHETKLFNDAGLSDWDVSDGLNFQSMFQNAEKFNAPLADWQIFNAIDTSNMFTSASSFNQNISQWNIENVITMSGMFNEATEFDQDVTTWEIPKQMEDMSLLFRRTKLNHDYCDWSNQISNTTKIGRMFFRTNCEIQTDPEPNATTGLLHGPFCYDCYADGLIGPPSGAASGNMMMMSSMTTMIVVMMMMVWK